MDQARIDIFLDEGWCLIDQLHQWSASGQVESENSAVLNRLICDLQKLWSTADDLQLNRLARTILAVEQILERICARSFLFNGERFQHVAAGIESLQELLLGFEATREEPDFANFGVLLRMEQAAREINQHDNDPSIVLIDPTAEATSLSSMPEESNSASSMIPASNSPLAVWTSQTAIDPSRVVLLEQFTANLEDVCRGLLARIRADEAPYATTASRLEYLAEETRILAEQIVDEVRQLGSAPIERASEVPSETCGIDEQPRAIEGPSIEFLPVQVETLSVANDSARLPRLTSIPECSSQSLGFAVAETKNDSIRVLIIEESLFYRNLLGIAVESAGYHPQLAESAVQGFEMLQRATDLCAVLVGSKVSPILANAIEQFRRQMNFKVIGMTLPGHEKVPVPDLDSRISKMHPQQLIAELDKMLNRSTDPTRKSA